MFFFFSRNQYLKNYTLIVFYNKYIGFIYFLTSCIVATVLIIFKMMNNCFMQVFRTSDFNNPFLFF